MRLTWKRQASETGLRRIGQGKKSHYLRLNGKEIATVSYTNYNAFFPNNPVGWYWSCSSNDELGIPSYNGEQLFETVEEAKADCKSHIVEYINKANKGNHQ